MTSPLGQTPETGNEMIYLVFDNIEIVVVLLCSSLNVLFGNRKVPIVKRATNGAMVGVLLIVVVALFRFFSKSSFSFGVDLGELPWGWIIFGVVVVLFLIGGHEVKKEKVEMLKSTDTLRDLIEFLPIRLGLSSKPIQKNILDQAVNYAHSSWEGVVDIAVSGDKDKENLLERAEELFEKKLFSVLPKEISMSWGEKEDEEKTEIFKEFIELKLKKQSDK